MKKTTLTILGYALEFKYTVYTGGYIEWDLVVDVSNDQQHLWETITPPEIVHPKLLTTLLRMHYTPVIEAELRKIHFTEEYELSQINAGHHGIDEDIPF